MSKSKKKRKQDLALNLEYRVYVTDKKGRIVRDTGFKESKSFLIQFMLALYMQMGQWTGVQIKDVGGVTRSCNRDSITLRLLTQSPSEDYGIVIGTGTTAVAWDDYQLENQINHGLSANQLQYTNQPEPSGPLKVGSNIEMLLNRAFTNEGGVTVTVNEIGVYSMIGPTTTWYFCLIRDKLASGVDIDDGETLHVAYKFTMPI